MRVQEIHQVAIAATDLEVSTAFYRDQLGAEFIAMFDPPGLAFFNFSGVRLLLDRNAPKSVVYFRVPDIAAAAQELSDGGIKLTSEPHVVFTDSEGQFGEPGKNEWMAFFEDPAGNTLAIASRQD